MFNDLSTEVDYRIVPSVTVTLLSDGTGTNHSRKERVTVERVRYLGTEGERLYFSTVQDNRTWYFWLVNNVIGNPHQLVPYRD